MRDPVHHIARPTLPWRSDEALTECRLDSRSYPTWSRDEARRQARDLGKTRFYMVVCVTCLHTAERHATWSENPMQAMIRECEGSGMGGWRVGSEDRFHQIRNELLAIEALIAAHPDEFAELVAGIGSTVNLGDKRTERVVRRARLIQP